MRGNGRIEKEVPDLHMIEKTYFMHFHGRYPNGLHGRYHPHLLLRDHFHHAFPGIHDLPPRMCMGACALVIINAGSKRNYWSGWIDLKVDYNRINHGVFFYMHWLGNRKTVFKVRQIFLFHKKLCADKWKPSEADHCIIY